jgi:hypothetical protein
MFSMAKRGVWTVLEIVFYPDSLLEFHILVCTSACTPRCLSRKVRSSLTWNVSECCVDWTFGNDSKPFTAKLSPILLIFDSVFYRPWGFIISNRFGIGNLRCNLWHFGNRHAIAPSINGTRTAVAFAHYFVKTSDYRAIASLSITLNY